MCSTCVVVLCKTPCFGKYHMKKSYWTGMQKFNDSRRIIQHFFFKKLSWIIICIGVKKWMYTACIFDLFRKRPARVLVAFKCCCQGKCEGGGS
jgi:hypothetical protein